MTTAPKRRHPSSAALAAGGLLLSAVAAHALGGVSPIVAALVGVGGALVIVLAAWRREWEVPLHGATAALLGVLAWTAEPGAWWVVVIAVVNIAGSFWVAITRGRRRAREAEARSEQLAAQLDRRISELFSLQELSYVLSESIQLDRIVEQVARYAARFLQTDGAIVVLADGEGARALRVAAATGSLESLLGHGSTAGDGTLVGFAIGRERIEVAQGVATPEVNLFARATVRSAAVAPLRSQGVTMGALAVADRRGGPFTTEDLWLLSTVATNASVVLANARLYEMVRRSKEEWETAFDALTEGIAVVTPRSTVVRANRALAALAGLTEPEVVGRDFREMLFGDPVAVPDIVAAAYRGERSAPLVARADRTGRVLRLTAAPVTERGRAGPVVVLVEDVTEARLLEAQLIQNDKMASIGQLVSGVAHELNNPLTSIAGLAELLLERNGGADEVPREHLRVIHDQAERAGRIVRNLLTFARKGVAEKAPVDLDDVISRTALLIVYELQLHGVELEWSPGGAPLLVLGDRYELQQVLLNLMTNAVQALSTLEPGRPRRLAVTATRVGNEAVVTVRDSGPGVPPHLVAQLFTPFFTTKAPGEGTGLGLSVSYGLVKAHGGQLTYRAPLEGGAEFRVTLPCYDPRARPAPQPAPPAAHGTPQAAHAAAHAPQPTGAAANGQGAPGVGPRRILLVDDDPAVHRVVSAAFAPDGHTVDAARSGERGLELSRGRPYDLVIADARMPAGPTELFAPALLAADPRWGGRLVLASPDPPDSPEPFPGHAVRWLRKPLNPRDLRAVAGEVFGGR